MSVRAAMIVAVCCLLAGARPTLGQTPQEAETLARVQAQLDAQQAEIRVLQDRLAAYEAGTLAPSSASSSAFALPEAIEWDAGTADPLRYRAEYDQGLRLEPVDPQRDPFSLTVRGSIQFRHHAFARDVQTWTDNAGFVRPVDNRNAFDIERGRLSLAGFALDERLTYFLQLDGDTDGLESVDFFDYFWAWEFSDRFQVQVGKRKVTAIRQWLLSSRLTRMIDRPMANDFFRPDRTLGLFALGRIGETGRYEAMVGNGYRTANLPLTAVDDKFTFAWTNFFDPWGDYGGPLVDEDMTSAPLLRLGHSLVYSPQKSDLEGIPLGEADFVRLSDGTRLTEFSAVTPGVTISDFTVYLYGIDAAFKYRGWSANAEVYFRWLQNLRGDGPLTVTKIAQRGFYVEGGRFLIPRKLDVNVRYSQVSGLLGNASEVAAGLTWRPLGTPRLKLAFDVTELDGSPLQNTSSDILVGDDGTLFRTQLQAEF